MSSDPWVIEKQESKVNYGQCQIVRTEKSGSNGNTYFEMMIYITPFEPEKQIIESKLFNFSPEFQKITIPSVMKLVSAGKLTSPADLEKDEKFVSYKWSEYKSYESRDISYWQDKNPDKLSVDDKGRTFKGKLAIEFVDIFTDETVWRQAAESTEPVVQPVATVEVNKEDAQSKAMLDAIPIIIQNCDTIEKLITALAIPPFSLDNPIVKQAIIKEVNNRANNDIGQQVILLAEINTHFETPYLELTDLLAPDEIPFN